MKKRRQSAESDARPPGSPQQTPRTAQHENAPAWEPAFLDVCIPRGCCNEVTKTGWLKIKEIHFLKMLEATNLKSSGFKIMLSLKGLGEDLFQDFVLDSTIAGNPWHSWLVEPSLQPLLLSLHGALVYLFLHMVFSSVCASVSLLLFLQGPQSYWIRAHPDDLILT